VDGRAPDALGWYFRIGKALTRSYQYLRSHPRRAQGSAESGVNHVHRPSVNLWMNVDRVASFGCDVADWNEHFGHVEMDREVEGHL
jgi:hypothetical protein